MNELSLYSGAGGGLLGSRLLGWRAVCYVENDPYCVKVLQARIKDGFLDDAPIWDDARTFDGRPWRGCVDIVTAGFPCQPFSVAGKRKGEADERNLWPDTRRIIEQARPQWVFLENVPGIASYIPTIRRDLVAAGYRWRRPAKLPACLFDALHRRFRLWFIAYSNSEGCSVPRSVGGEAPFPKLESCGDWWSPRTPESRICRVADGVAHRVDRLRALGNGQVPAVVREAWRRLTERIAS